MVRRGWFVLMVPVAVVAAGCSGDDDEAAPASTTVAEAPPATLPDEAEPGRGYLLLDGAVSVLTVGECSFEPVVDEVTGVTTELAVAAQDTTGRLVDVVRSSFTADVPTVTDTITLTPAGEGAAVLAASRAETAGRFIDLRVPSAVGPLLEVDAPSGTVRADGVFGPEAGRPGGDGEVAGELLLRCPGP